MTRIKTRRPMRRLSTRDQKRGITAGPRKSNSRSSNLWDQRALPRVVRVSRYIVQKVKWRPGTYVVRTRQCGYTATNFNSADSYKSIQRKAVKALGIGNFELHVRSVLFRLHSRLRSLLMNFRFRLGSSFQNGNSKI